MTTEPIAIVGIGALLPGAHNEAQFWEAMIDGRDLRTQAGVAQFGTGPQIPGGWGDPEQHITSVRGGFVEEPSIDLTCLGVPAERLAAAGPLGRWPVHVVRRALADIGLAPGHPELARTGIVLGNYSFPTRESVELCVPAVQAAVARGMRDAGILPQGAGSPPLAAADTPVETIWPSGLPIELVSGAFGMAGPRLALDAACSSALYAVRLAADYLSAGAADVMVAGAVCAPDPLLIHLSFSDLQAYPDNGVSRPFARASTGIVTGQGAGVLPSSGSRTPAATATASGR